MSEEHAFTNRPTTRAKPGAISIDRDRFVGWLKGWRSELRAEGLEGVRSNANIKTLAIELEERLAEILRVDSRSLRPKNSWLVAGPDAIEKWSKCDNTGQSIQTEFAIAWALYLVSNQDLTHGQVLEKLDFTADPRMAKLEGCHAVRISSNDTKYEIKIDRAIFGKSDARKLSDRFLKKALAFNEELPKTIGFVSYGLSNVEIEIQFSSDISVGNEIKILRHDDESERGEIRGASLLRESAKGDQRLQLRLDRDHRREPYILAAVNNLHTCDISVSELQDGADIGENGSAPLETTTDVEEEPTSQISSGVERSITRPRTKVECQVVTRNSLWTSFQFDEEWLRSPRFAQDETTKPDEAWIAQQLIQAVFQQRSKGEWMVARRSVRLHER